MGLNFALIMSATFFLGSFPAAGDRKRRKIRKVNAKLKMQLAGLDMAAQ